MSSGPVLLSEWPFGDLPACSPRLPEELGIRHGSRSFGGWLLQLPKTDVLALDDWGMVANDRITRSDPLEIIDDPAENKATIITSRRPVEHRHAWIR